MLLSLKSIWVFDLLTLTNPWNYLEAVQVHLSGIKSVKWQPSSNRLLKKIPQFFGSTGHSYSTSSSKCVIRPLKVTKGKKNKKTRSDRKENIPFRTKRKSLLTKQHKQSFTTVASFQKHTHPFPHKIHTVGKKKKIPETKRKTFWPTAQVRHKSAC